MQKTILRYGLLSGAVAALLMVVTALRIRANPDFENGYFYGYAGILLSMVFVFLGVRSYREQVNGGTISFGKGLQIGLLIALISGVFYALTWMVASEIWLPDFMAKFVDHSLAKLQASGADPAEIERQTATMRQYQEMYKNPLLKFGLTFLEPFPVGLLVALLSALILRKKTRKPPLDAK
ncbi:MAG: DUF4199 domain-containing protein, partial [Saprospiraceae bacterium]